MEVALCPKKKVINLTLKTESIPNAQKLSLHFHDDIIKTKAVATKEGVWKGVYRPADLLKANYKWLKGVPITLNHPVDGVNNSALAIGQVIDVVWDEEEKRVLAECDLYASKCPPELITKIAAGDFTEVSTGFYADQEPLPGKWNDQDYAEVEKTLFFDHLALVPTGACSLKDGCGMGAHGDINSIKSHEGNEKVITSNQEGNCGDIIMSVKFDSMEDFSKFTEDFSKIEDPVAAKATGIEALKLLSSMATGKTGIFTPPKMEAPAKVTYPMPKMIKAQDAQSLTLTFEPTEDPEAAKGAFTVLYSEAVKSLADKDALIKKLTDEKATLQGEKDAIEGGVRKEQVALIQAHSGISDEEAKAYETLPIPQLKAVALHMQKALQVHTKDPKTKFLLPDAGGKKLSVAELDAEFDKALGFKPKK